MCLNTSEWFLWKRKWEGRIKGNRTYERGLVLDPQWQGAWTLENIKLCNGEKKDVKCGRGVISFPDLPCVNGCLWNLSWLSFWFRGANPLLDNWLLLAVPGPLFEGLVLAPLHVILAFTCNTVFSSYALDSTAADQPLSVPLQQSVSD